MIGIVDYFEDKLIINFIYIVFLLNDFYQLCSIYLYVYLFY